MTVTTQVETADGETTTETHTVDLTYDASGNPQTMTYDGTTYYYTVNIQGDVTGIVDENGTVLARYTYLGNGLKSAATFLWDAYMRGYSIQQNAQIAETQLTAEYNIRITKAGIENGIQAAAEAAVVSGINTDKTPKDIAISAAVSFGGGYIVGVFREIFEIIEEALSADKP